MDKQFVTTSESPHVLIETAQGNLRLKGHDDLEVVAKANKAEELSIEQRENEIVIRSQSDLSVRVPRQASVIIKTVQGEASFKGLDGSLEIDTVQGHLTLRGVGLTRVNQVQGELSAKNVGGDLLIKTVAGNATVRDVQGSFIVSDVVQGSLRLDDVGGDASAKSQGNVNLRLDPAPGQTYSFEADGNIFCRLSEDPSVELCCSKAAKVVVNLPDMKASAPLQAPYAITLGEGDAELTLSAKGNVVIDSHAPDWDMEDFDVEIGADMGRLGDEIGQQFEQQIEAQMRMIEANLNTQMASLTSRLGAARLTEDQARRVEERARQASERASAMAQERMRRAQEKMDQKLAAAQRKIEHRSHTSHATGRRSRWGVPIPPVPPVPPAPPIDPVSEEERLMILRMLEQKKISLAEAETLLSALEGKESAS